MTGLQGAVMIGFSFFILIAVIACAIRLTLIWREVEALRKDLQVSRSETGPKS